MIRQRLLRIFGDANTAGKATLSNQPRAEGTESYPGGKSPTGGGSSFFVEIELPPFLKPSFHSSPLKRIWGGGANLEEGERTEQHLRFLTGEDLKNSSRCLQRARMESAQLSGLHIGRVRDRSSYNLGC